MAQEVSEVQKQLNEFRDAVIDQARANLKALKKDVTGRLSKSITGEVKQMPNSLGFYFDMEPYGQFQDKGVNGKKSVWNSPFSFKNKMPPPSKLDSWMVRKGIAPRDAKGRLLPRKTMQFLIARSIFRHGIKPSLFFTNAFQAEYKKLPDELIKKYGLDVERLVLDNLDDFNKKFKK